MTTVPRNTQVILKDIFSIASLGCHQLTIDTAITHDLLWAWTIRFGETVPKGKFEQSPWKSEGAIAEIKTGTKPGKNGKLRHEHAVPKALLRGKIITSPPTSPTFISDLLHSFGVGVVIAKLEQKALDSCKYGAGVTLRQEMPLGPNWGNGRWCERFAAFNMSTIDKPIKLNFDPSEPSKPNVASYEALYPCIGCKHLPNELTTKIELLRNGGQPLPRLDNRQLSNTQMKCPVTNWGSQNIRSVQTTPRTEISNPDKE